MKAMRDIIARSVILLCISDRCALEKVSIEGVSYTKKQREEQRLAIYKWLDNKGYSEYLTKEEKELFELEVDGNNKSCILSKQMQYEAIEPCLWAIGLVNGLSNYNNAVLTDFHPILQIGARHTLEAIMAECKLKSNEEVLLNNKISMIWYWRTREYSNSLFESKPLTEIIRAAFNNEEYEKATDIALKRNGGTSDFLVKDKQFGELTYNEVSFANIISQWRYHAFEWLISDNTWNEIELNT